MALTEIRIQVMKCCSRINDKINEKYIYKGSVDDINKIPCSRFKNRTEK